MVRARDDGIGREDGLGARRRARAVRGLRHPRRLARRATRRQALDAPRGRRPRPVDDPRADSLVDAPPLVRRAPRRDVRGRLLLGGVSALVAPDPPGGARRGRAARRAGQCDPRQRPAADAGSRPRARRRLDRCDEPGDGARDRRGHVRLLVRRHRHRRPRGQARRADRRGQGGARGDPLPRARPAARPALARRLSRQHARAGACRRRAVARVFPLRRECARPRAPLRGLRRRCACGRAHRATGRAEGRPAEARRRRDARHAVAALGPRGRDAVGRGARRRRCLRLLRAARQRADPRDPHRAHAGSAAPEGDVGGDDGRAARRAARLSPRRAGDQPHVDLHVVPRSSRRRSRSEASRSPRSCFATARRSTWSRHRLPCETRLFL